MAPLAGFGGCALPSPEKTAPKNARRCMTIQYPRRNMGHQLHRREFLKQTGLGASLGQAARRYERIDQAGAGDVRILPGAASEVERAW